MTKEEIISAAQIIEKEIDRHIRFYETRKQQIQAIKTNWKGWQADLAIHILTQKKLKESFVNKIIKNHNDSSPAEYEDNPSTE